MGKKMVMCTGKTGSMGGQQREGTTASQRIDANIEAIKKGLAAMTKARELTAAEQLAAELKEPGNENVVASINTETGEIGAVYLEPTPAENEDVGRYDHLEVGQPYPLGPARRTELMQRLDALERIADDSQSSQEARKRAALAAASIRKLLRTLDPAPIAPKGTGEGRPGYGGV